MTTVLEAIVGGEVFNLSDGLVRAHLGNDGWGLPSQDRKTSRGPRQHGVTHREFVLEPRTLQLMLLTHGEDDNGYWDRRDELAYIFAPSDDPIQLRFTRPDGSQRQIDCYYDNGLSLPSSERHGHSQKVVVTLTADDPTWYSPSATSLSFGLAAGGQALNVPLAVPMAVGSSTLDQTYALNYTGTWDAYPVVTIQGPITNPVIENQSTGDVLDFTGYTIGGGDYYTIDTRYGSKRVYKNGNLADSRINELTNDSDLATFRVVRKPIVLAGQNVFRVTGTGVNSATQVYLSFNTRYTTA